MIPKQHCSFCYSGRSCLTKHFDTFLFYSFCHCSHCTTAWSRSWNQGKCQRQGPLFSDKEIQVVILLLLQIPAGPRARKALLDPQEGNWAWIGCWEHSLILSFRLLISALSREERQRRKSTAKGQKYFISSVHICFSAGWLSFFHF